MFELSFTFMEQVNQMGLFCKNQCFDILILCSRIIYHGEKETNGNCSKYVRTSISNFVCGFRSYWVCS